MKQKSKGHHRDQRKIKVILNSKDFESKDEIASRKTVLNPKYEGLAI